MKKATKKFTNEAWFMHQLRKSRGFSQSKVADMITLHPQSISNLERGVAGISMDQWAKLQLCIDFDWRELADAMAMDERNFCLSFMDLEPYSSRTATLTPSEFMAKVNEIFEEKKLSDITEDYFHNVTHSKLATKEEITLERLDLSEKDKRNLQDRVYG